MGFFYFIEMPDYLQYDIAYIVAQSCIRKQKTLNHRMDQGFRIYLNVISFS